LDALFSRFITLRAHKQLATGYLLKKKPLDRAKQPSAIADSGSPRQREIKSIAVRSAAPASHQPPARCAILSSEAPQFLQPQADNAWR
jgi:hypothetical protein